MKHLKTITALALLLNGTPMTAKAEPKAYKVRHPKWASTSGMDGVRKAPPKGKKTVKRVKKQKAPALKPGEEGNGLASKK